MENSYGIGVRNRYELFYNEDVDPLEIISRAEKKKKDKGPEKENKIKTKDSKVSPKSPKNDLENKTNQEKVPQQGNLKSQKTERVKFSDREERNNRRNKNDEWKDSTNIVEEAQKDNKEVRENGVSQQRVDNEARMGRGGGRGVAGFRGGRGARRGARGGPGNAGEFRGKREFDRQSGMVTSGVKAVDKREGSGSYNWGSDKEQIDEQQNQVDNADLDTSVESPEKANTEDGTAATTTGEGDASKEDAEQREMTLDEWKALQKRDKPQFKIRRAGEGENQAQWKKTYVLKKKEEDAMPPSELDSEEDNAEAHHGRKKVFIPIDFQFSDTPTRGRGRGRGGRGGTPGGGRGRGMGGRGGGRGRYQGGPNRQQAPKMDDERDFPSLN